MGLSYKDAGVDIDAAESAVDQIKSAVKNTYNDNVVSEVGLFGGFYSFPKDDYDQPVLVASTDGVGTKLKLAFQTGMHTTVGQDLVNHCVNDILTSGAVPLFFLDYIGIGSMNEAVVVDIVKGFAQACEENHCVLIGGELAEMAGFYQPGEYDLSGTVVGVVERAHILNGDTITPGDVIIGLPSNGLHTNGYTLARKVLLDEYDVTEYHEEFGMTVGEEMLRVHKSYLNVIAPLVGSQELHGIAHITGGGLLGNMRRILPDQCGITMNWEAWTLPPVFRIIRDLGGISSQEMHRTFNCGIGLTIVVAETNTEQVCAKLEAAGEAPVIIGEIEAKGQR